MELNINPEFNLDIDLLKSEVDSLRIKSESDNIHASRLLGKIDNLLDDVTGRRDGIIDEYEQRIEDTKSEYSPYIKSLKALKDTVKTEMLSYKKRAREIIQNIQADIASGKIERKQTYIGTDGKIVGESALSIRTGEGLSSVREYYTVRVTDLSKVPIDYIKADKNLLMAAAKKGIKNIPGVEIKENEAMQYRGIKKDVA